MNNYQKFLLELGDNDAERAEALGVSLRTFYRYKKGETPSAKIICRFPVIAEAIAQDTRETQETPLLRALADDADGITQKETTQ